jgi:hypothetical protein
VSETRGRRLATCVVAAAIALNITFFFKPYSKGVKEASYKTVGIIRHITESTLDRIDNVGLEGPMFLVNDGDWVSFRVIEYYYPSAPLLYIPGPNARIDNPPPVWLFKNRHLAQSLDAAGELKVPACGNIVWMVSDGATRQRLLAIDGAEAARYFVATPAHPGMHFQVGRYRFATSTELCGQGS